jgi:hypothetical protein
MDDRFELIDAFVDGERVDAAALKRLLAEEAGRDYFIDTWLLREGVLDEVALESVPQAPPRHDRRWPMLAIAASLACLMIGGLAGYRLGVPGDDVRTPATAATSPARAPETASFPPPAPTREIPVEFNSASGVRGGN